jgi:hypothetical protein
MPLHDHGRVYLCVRGGVRVQHSHQSRCGIQRVSLASALTHIHKHTHTHCRAHLVQCCQPASVELALRIIIIMPWALFAIVPCGAIQVPEHHG